MRILILNKKANGVINLQEQEHFILENITDFGQVLKKMIEAQKSYFDYKYCVLEDGSFIPFFIKIKSKLMNQMEEFTFDRVKFSELNIGDAEKERIIKNVVSKSNLANIEEVEKKAIKLIIKREFGEIIDKRMDKLKEEIKKSEKEIINIDYKKYLDEYV